MWIFQLQPQAFFQLLALAGIGFGALAGLVGLAVAAYIESKN